LLSREGFCSFGTRCVLALGFMLMGVMTCTEAGAAKFSLVEGKQYEVCREYAKNLDFFSASITRNTKIFPLLRFKEFQQPRWQRVNANKKFDLVQKFYRWNNDPTSSLSSAEETSRWQAEVPLVEHEIRNETVRLERAHFNFDNDGHADEVYRLYHPYRYAGWQPDSSPQIYGYWFIYESSVDTRISETFRAFSGEDRLYNAVLFRGRTFLIGWLVGELEIFEPSVVQSRMALTPVCIFRYQP